MEIKEGLVRRIFNARRIFQSVSQDFRTLLQRTPQSKVEDLHSKFGVQEAIFGENCRLILYLVAENHQDIHKTFENQDHLMLVMAGTEKRLEAIMGRYYSYSAKVLLHIQEVVEDLHKRLQRVVKVKEYQKWTYQWTYLKVPSLVVTSLLLDRSLGVSLDHLQEYNDYFSTIIGQATLKRIDHARPPLYSYERKVRCNCLQSGIPKSDFPSYYLQQASEDLWKALSCTWSCHESSTYSYYINLEFDDAPIITADRGVEFNIVVTTPPTDKPFRLLIQPQLIQDGIFLDLSNLSEGKDFVCKPQSRPHTSCSGDLVKRFERNSYDLNAKQDLCFQLRDLVCSSERQEGKRKPSKLEFLEARENPMYFLFCQSDSHREDHPPYPLDDFLTKEKVSKNALSIERKLWLAKDIARCLLYLHSTSWLSQEWSSNDIHFFDHEDFGARTVLKRPFIRMQVGRRADRTSCSETEASEKVIHVLYRFGLVLLEIAFDAPWCDLQLHNGATKDLRTTERENLTIAQLSQTVSNRLGSRYARVVRNCFSYGISPRELDSLEKPQTCLVVFYDIVRELDSCLLAVSARDV